MDKYSQFTPDSFYKRLVEQGIRLRKSDVAQIVKEVEAEQGISEIVRMQQAYERASALYEKMNLLRKVASAEWDGRTERRRSV